MNEPDFAERIELKNICMSIIKGKNLDNLLNKMRRKIYARIDSLNSSNQQELINLKWQLEALKALRQEIQEIAHEKIN